MSSQFDTSIMDILSNWNLQPIRSIERIQQGVINVNWRIKSSSGEYILKRIASDKNKDDILFEFEYLRYLEKHGFPYAIPSPIPTKSNKLYIEVDKRKYYCYKYIQGTILSEFDTIELQQIAQMMSIYHSILVESKLDNGHKRASNISRNNYYQWILNEMQEYMNSLERKQILKIEDKVFLSLSCKLYSILEGIKTWKYTQYPRYPIHRDMGGDNLI